jgi:hypothetical protein
VLPTLGLKQGSETSRRRSLDSPRTVQPQRRKKRKKEHRLRALKKKDLRRKHLDLNKNKNDRLAQATM